MTQSASGDNPDPDGHHTDDTNLEPLLARLDELIEQLSEAYDNSPRAVTELLRELDAVCERIDQLRGFKP